MGSILFLAKPSGPASVGCPAPRDPIEEFKLAASKVGLIRPGDPLDQRLIDYAFAIVERCACVAEPFGNDDHTASAAIRAELGDHH
jgi:hypothetical protein